jgi:hypothetical protein
MAGMKVKYGLALSEARYKRFIRPLPTGTGRSMVTRVTGSTSDMNKDPGHSLVNRESEERWVLNEGSVLPKGMRGRPSDKWRRSNPKGSQRFSGKGSIETVKSITR